MNFSTEFLTRLVTNPAERLDVELKPWLDPETPEGTAKIVKACLALRNNNGGFLVIGFDNTGKPLASPDPESMRAKYHIDTIQGIVAGFASHSFEVQVEFVTTQNAVHPVICVPSGVVTPVAAKKDLTVGEKKVVVNHGVYVRSLSSNNTPSSTLARIPDWEPLTKRCFDNREADIGGFIRRHLSGENAGSFGQLLAKLTGDDLLKPAPTAVERALAYLETGRERFESRLEKRSAKLPDAGTLETAVIITGSIPEHSSTQEFLTNLQIRKPYHSGWTPWIDSKGSSETSNLPYTTRDGCWEALVVVPNDFIFGESVDFWRIDPRGSFYQIRFLEDDLRNPVGGPKPKTQIDFAMQVSRIAETISVCTSFARIMGCDESDSTITFAFRWRGMEGRHLTSWANPQRWFHAPDPSQEDEITSSVSIPLEVPQSGLASFVDSATKELFALFGGFRFQPQVIEEIVRETLARRFR